MNIDSILAAGMDVASTAPKPKDDPAKILNAARQFESLLVAQMMKSMQDAEGGWLGTEYGQEAFAQAMSANGGLGLAKMVAAGLQQAAKE